MKKWTVEITYEEESGLTINRINDGFNIMELTGMAQWILDDLLQYHRKETRVDQINRTVVKEKEK